MTLTEPLSLSDEELVLLNAEHPLVSHPYLEELEPPLRDVAVRTALRSLRLHGMPFDEATGGITLPLEVVELLQGRSTAQRILFLRKQIGSIETVRYVHFDHASLICEDVSGDGVHTFGVRPAACLRDVVADFVAVPDAVDGVGASVLMRAEQTPGPWGAVLASIDAAVWRASPASQPPVLLGVTVGDRGTYVSRGQLGAGGPIEMRPMGVECVPEQIVELLAEIRCPGE